MDVDGLLRQIQNMGPGAEDRVRSGFARTTKLSPEQEESYQQDMHAKGLSRYIHDPTYDNRAAWLNGQLPDRMKDPGVHGDSIYKGLGDDRLMLPVGPGNSVVDTRTMKAPNPQLVNLWKVVSRLMNQ